MIGGYHGTQAVIRGAMGAPLDAPPHPGGLLPTQRYNFVLFCSVVLCSVLSSHGASVCFRDDGESGVSQGNSSHQHQAAALH